MVVVLWHQKQVESMITERVQPAVALGMRPVLNRWQRAPDRQH